MRFMVLIATVLALSQTTAWAQSGTIQGKITDKQTGAPLSGARITLRTSPTSAVIGKVSSKTGEYTIAAPPGDYTFQVTFVGYKTYSTSVKVEDNSVASISPQMIIDIKGVDEIVVTGVASRRERGVSEVSVGRLDAEQLTENNKYTEIGQVLTGKVPGIRIGQSTGQAGNGFYIRSRGGTGLFGGAPLVFVDGVRVSSGNFIPDGFDYGGQNFSALSGVNPDDIENIEVLKGPAGSALYGTSGQNGVILITTKSGKSRGGAQEELKINYQVVSGWSEPHKKYTTDMFETADDINRVYRTAPLTQNSLNLTGTSGIFSYYAGIEQRNEEGIMRNNSFDRTSVRANFDAVTSKNLSLSFRSNYMQSVTDMPNNDNTIFGWLGNTIAANTLSGPYSFLDSAAVAALSANLSVRRFIGSAEVNYLPSILPELQLKGVIGVDNFSRRLVDDAPPGFRYQTVEHGSRSIGEANTQRVNIDLSATLSPKIMDDFSTVFIAGLQAFDTRSVSTRAGAEEFPTELIKDISTGQNDSTKQTYSVAEGFSHFRDAGVYARFEGNYDQVYYLSLGIRNDYASTLSQAASSVLYPQASAAVRLDRLGILPESFNLFKARIAYGQTGSLPASTASKAYLWSGAQSGAGSGAVLKSAGNADILPERIAELEFGADIEFDNAYGAEFSYFLQSTKDAIINVPRAPSTGLGDKPTNIGKIDGWGFETMVYATPLRTAGYELGLTAILNHSDNEVIDIGPNEFLAYGFYPLSNYFMPGLRRGTYMDYKAIAPRFRADGYYDALLGPLMDTTKRVDFGSAVPLYTGSITINFRFLTDFTISAMTEFALGGSILNWTKRFGAEFGNVTEFNTLANKLGLAQGQTGGGFFRVPRLEEVKELTPGTPEYQAAAEQFMRMEFDDNRGVFGNYIEKADWWRIREVSLRWNAMNTIRDLFPEQNVVRDLSLLVSVRNLALFTNYSGIDTELNSFGTDTAVPSTDFFTTMQARVFNFTLNVGL